VKLGWTLIGLGILILGFLGDGIYFALQRVSQNEPVAKFSIPGFVSGLSVWQLAGIVLVIALLLFFGIRRVIKCRRKPNV
jgi:membrane protein implicated in regulation of membrane protease activity